MRLFREPLFHFLILGAVIFAAHGLITRHKTDKPGEIVVTQGAVENLVTGFTRTWQRPPTEDELRGLVSDYIREEAAYREALALGLDRDDMIVRRRLQQKLEFLSDDLATRTQPSDADLQSFLQAHKGMFQTEPLLLVSPNLLQSATAWSESSSGRSSRARSLASTGFAQVRN